MIYYKHMPPSLFILSLTPLLNRCHTLSLVTIQCYWCRVLLNDTSLLWTHIHVLNVSAIHLRRLNKALHGWTFQSVWLSTEPPSWWICKLYNLRQFKEAYLDIINIQFYKIPKCANKKRHNFLNQKNFLDTEPLEKECDAILISREILQQKIYLYIQPKANFKKANLMLKPI